METNFGTSTPYSVGIEEEFQLVDPDSLELVSRIEPILASVGGETIRERVGPELLQSMLEISTRIAVTVEEAVDEVVDLRSRLGRIAADHGVALAASGTHPFSRCDAQRVTERPRYTELADSLGWLVSRQPVFGLHVHIGAGSAAKAIACADGLRNHVPELLALSANSPLRHGRPTGHASTRATILEDLPRTGLPPALGVLRDLRGIRRAGCPRRVLPRLHAHLVGRSPASAARHRRDADLRRADARVERRRDRGARPVARRDRRQRLRVRRRRAGRLGDPARGEPPPRGALRARGPADRSRGRHGTARGRRDPRPRGALRACGRRPRLRGRARARRADPRLRERRGRAAAGLRRDRRMPAPWFGGSSSRRPAEPAPLAFQI